MWCICGCYAPTRSLANTHPPAPVVNTQCYVHEAVGLQDAAIRAYQRAVANNDPDGIAVHKLVGRGACVLALWWVMAWKGLPVARG